MCPAESEVFVSTQIVNRERTASAPSEGKERAPEPPLLQRELVGTASNIRSLRDFKDGLAVRPCKETDHAWLYNLLQRSFPKEECVSKEQLLAWMKHDRARAFILLAAEPDQAPKRIGLFLGSQMNGFFFGEYLAMDPSVRNQGYGRRFLFRLKEILNQPMVFECELPEDSEIARRRYHFYLRLGFFRYDYDYTMPALRESDDPIPMCLMGAVERIDSAKIDEVVLEIYRRAYPHVIRLKANEDLIEIA